MRRKETGLTAANFLLKEKTVAMTVKCLGADYRLGGIWYITVTPNVFCISYSFLRRSAFLSWMLYLDTSGHFHSA